MLLNPYLATTGVGTGGGGPTYFFEERFEDPAGYENSWTETGTGTITENYTGVILEGSQSLRLAATAQAPKTNAVLPSDQDELWIFFRMRVVTPLAAARTLACLLDSGGTVMTGINLNTTNNFLALTTTIGSTASVDAMTEDVDYNVWWHSVKGTGANGFCSIGFSTTGTEVTAGNAYCQKNNGANTNDFHSIQFQITNAAGTNSTGEMIFDKILISNTATIGNDPA